MTGKRRKTVKGVGTIMDSWGLGPTKGRAPNGDYLWGIAMKTIFPGCRPRTSRKVHQIPKNRTHLVNDGSTYPVKGDPDEPKSVEIDWENFQRIDGRKVLNRIVTRVGRVLRSAGYKKVTPRTFNAIKEDGLIHVIDFQGSRWGDGFTVNVAVFVRELRRGRANKVDESRVGESDCTWKLRWRMGELTRTRGDKWWSYESPDETAEELIAGLTKFVLPYLGRYESRALLHKTWRNARPKGTKKRRN
jgi:Domain of unknown function (DUF4304)